MPYHHHHHHHNPQPNYYDYRDYILSLNPQLQTR